MKANEKAPKLSGILKSKAKKLNVLLRMINDDCDYWMNRRTMFSAIITSEIIRAEKEMEFTGNEKILFFVDKYGEKFSFCLMPQKAAGFAFH